MNIHTDTDTDTRLMIHTDTDTDTAQTSIPIPIPIQILVSVSVWYRYRYWYQVFSQIIYLVSLSVIYHPRVPINNSYFPAPQQNVVLDSEYNSGKLQQAACIAVAFHHSSDTFSLGIHQPALGGSIGLEGFLLGFASLPWEGPIGFPGDSSACPAHLAYWDTFSDNLKQIGYQYLGS